MEPTDDEKRAKAQLIENPLVLMFQAPDGSLITKLHHPPDFGHEAYGLIICDLVRHVANSFGVPEKSVWKWIDRERRHPTTAVSGGREQ
jgi:hypothetical protein